MEIEEIIISFNEIINSLESLDCNESKFQEVKERCKKVRDKLNLIINI